MLATGIVAINANTLKFGGVSIKLNKKLQQKTTKQKTQETSKIKPRENQANTKAKAKQHQDKDVNKMYQSAELKAGENVTVSLEDNGRNARCTQAFRCVTNTKFH